MKKILSFIAIVCMGYAASAQSSGSPALDTLDNAATVNILQPNATYYNDNGSGIWSVSAQATKISGTTAGYAILQGSIDGTNFAPLTGTSADSVALTNTSGLQFKNWYISNKRVAKVRVQFVGSGTQSTQVAAKFVKGD